MRHVHTDLMSAAGLENDSEVCVPEKTCDDAVMRRCGFTVFHYSHFGSMRRMAADRQGDRSTAYGYVAADCLIATFNAMFLQRSN